MKANRLFIDILKHTLALSLAMALASFPLQASEISIENEVPAQEERLAVHQDLRRATIPLLNQPDDVQESPTPQPLTKSEQGVLVVNSKKLYLLNCELTFYE